MVLRKCEEEKGDNMTDLPNTCGECDSSTYSETEKSLVCTLNANRLHVNNDSRYAFCPLLNKPEPLFSTERARRYLKYELPTVWPIGREVTE